MAAPGARASLDDWLAWQSSLSPEEIDLGLERPAEVLSRLDLPRPPRVLTVGGTNGKGSSVVMLHALYRTRGETVGAYLSPHVSRYEERIRLDDRLVTPTELVDAFEQVEAARGDVPLTYFEFGTLAAFVVFAQYGIDTAVLEVGLGGRLDAVNVLDHDGCLITNISLDHADWLGDDVESIAREKAGILRGGRPAVFASPDMPSPIAKQAAAVGADLIRRGRDFEWTAEPDGRWGWQGRETRLVDLLPPGLAGAHQYDNAAGVLALVEAVGPAGLLDSGTVKSSLATLKFAGRLQTIDAHDRHWLLDGAHNPAGANVLANALNERPVPPALAIVGILADKDADGIVTELGRALQRFVTLTPASPRAKSAEDLADLIAAATGAEASPAATPQAAFEAALATTRPGDLIVVAGSFYTLELALDWLGAA